MAEFVTVYEPMTHPIRGMASAKVGAMIPPGAGYFSLIQNFRWAESGVLAVRSGVTSALSGVIQAGSEPRGMASLPFFSYPNFLFASFKDAGNKTSVYYSTSAITWTNMTPSSGKHGDTRLSADDSGNDYETAFQVVHDRYTGRDCVIIQNGFDDPRVWDSGTTAIHRTITPPTRSNTWGATLGWRSFFTVSDETSTSYSGSPSHFTLADNGATGSNAVRVSQTTTAPSGSAAVTFSAAVNDNVDASVLDGTDCRQLAIVVRPAAGDHAIDHFKRNFRVNVKGVGSTVYNLYDPSSQIRQMTLVPADLASKTWVMAFSLDDVEPADLATLTRLEIEAISSATAPSAAYDLDLLCIAATGSVPGGASYAVSYFNKNSRSESYEQVLATNTDQIQGLGSRDLDHLCIPNSELLFYQTHVRFQNTTVAERDRGTDYLRVYRKQLGEELFTHVLSVDISTYTGGAWVFGQGSTELQLRATLDNRAPEDRDLWLTSPGAYIQPIPVSRTMALANNRLLCGARTSSDLDAFHRVSASAASMPFRFSSRPFDPNDLSAPFEERLPAENVQAFSVGSASMLGSNSVYAFTDQSVWLLNMSAVSTPALLSRVASVGTRSPFSVVERRGRVYFLDSDFQVQLLDGDQVRCLSRGLVDDRLAGIPSDRCRRVQGLWFNNRYFLFYTPVGGDVNSRALVFSETASAWEGDDLYPSPISVEFPVTWARLGNTYGSVSERRLIVLSSDAKTYRLETPGVGLDNGGAIDVQLTTGDLHQGMSEGMTVRGLGILCDNQNGRALTAVVSYKPDEGSASFSVSLDGAGAYRWGVERSPTAVVDPMRGVAAGLDYTGGLQGEKRIYALRMEVEPREAMAPVAG